jgi:hypothetical protein
VANMRVSRLRQVPAKTPVDQGLDAFHAEDGSAPAVPIGPTRVEQPDVPRSNSRRKLVIAAGAIVAVAAVSVAVALNKGWIANVFAVTPEPASLTVSTVPAGAQVFINGEDRGAAPLSLTLAAGQYQVRLRAANGQERVLDVSLREGQSMVQQIEWAATPAPVAATTGALHVQTDPPGQAVFVDDVRRGTTPLTVAELTPGEHRLVVSSESGSYRRAVSIKANETLSVVVAPQAPAVSAGWLRVNSPVLLQLRARGDLIGNTESDRVMLPAGEHDIEMVNDALGFVRTQRVTISAGRTADLRVAVPNGLLSINAVPWAEVWINGERLGETPLANISKPIGNYVVTFRHPQLGERQASVTVSAKATARVGIDMRQPQ